MVHQVVPEQVCFGCFPADQVLAQILLPSASPTTQSILNIYIFEYLIVIQLVAYSDIFQGEGGSSGSGTENMMSPPPLD